MSKFKGIVKLTDDQFNILKNTGSLTTTDGTTNTTITYDSQNTLYLTPNLPENLVLNDKSNTLTGNQEIVGDLTLTGNLNITGSVNEIQTQIVQSENDFIELRYGNSSALASNTKSGLKFIKYDGSTNGILAIDNTGTVYVGDEGDERPLTTRANLTASDDEKIIIWDDATKSITTSPNTIPSILSQIPTVNNATLTLQLNDSNIGTFTANASSDVIANIKALPNFSLDISHQSVGNPRIVKFVSVNYTNRATCFKMAAMTCHDNGVSYRFLTDMLIAVTTAGEVTADIYKFAQQEVGNVDGVARYTGDVFYVNDTTNKIVDFYILCGQWSNSQFTPITKVGSTYIGDVTQYSGTATYYSSGEKTWVNGCGTTYARLSDVNTRLALDGSNTMTGKLNLKTYGPNEGNIGPNGIGWDTTSLPEDTAPQFICTIDGFAQGGRQKWASIANLKTQLGVPTNYVTTDTDQQIESRKRFNEKIFVYGGMKAVEPELRGANISGVKKYIANGAQLGIWNMSVNSDGDLIFSYSDGSELTGGAAGPNIYA